MVATTVYMLPGLANDHTIFSQLNLPDVTIIHIPWIEPQKKESIEAYALRLCEYVTTPNPILIGLSFGGMVAIEIAKHIPSKKIILISSAKGKKEIPFYLRLLGKTRLQHIVPPSFILAPTPISYWFFGLKEKADKQKLIYILQHSSHSIYKWSLNALLLWKNTSTPKNLVHIHGTADRILPLRFVNANYTIKGGGHFMVFSHAQQVSALLLEIINT